MADNVQTPKVGGTNTNNISTEEVTTLNGASVVAQQVQRTIVAIRTADSTAIDLPGDADGGLKVNVSNFEFGLTEEQLRSEDVKVTLDSEPVTVANPGLTDTELRAADVKVTLDSEPVTIANPGLTDTELRATPIPVSGPLTDTQLRASDVKVTLDSEQVTISNPGLTDAQIRATPIPVSGPVTDSQIRATPIPVSGSVTSTPAASELHMGSVSGQGVKVNVEFTRPSDQTPYAVNDVLGPTGSASLLTFTNIARVNGGSFYIVRATIETNIVTPAQYTLQLYSTNTPTPIADNAQYPTIFADRAVYIGYIDFELSAIRGTGSDCTITVNKDIRLWGKCESNSRNIYGMLLTNTIFTPGSGQIYSITFGIEQD